MSNSMFFVGLSGLSAAQAALTTTGHNTANVNTAGYSRQSAQVESTTGVYMPGAGFFGGGVRVSDVTRSYDQYLVSQLDQAQSTSQSLNTYFTQVSRIDNLLADQAAGLAPKLQALFSDVQAVANSPADPSARQQLISSGQTLTNQFRTMDQYLTNLNSSINNQVSGTVDQINSYATQIANLNKQIGVLGGAGGQAPNDLLDQRDLMVSELGKLVGTKVIVQDGGQYNVFIGNGQTLVLGNNATRLATVSSAADPSRTTLATVNAAGTVVEMQESVISGGSLDGLLQFRNDSLTTAQNSLGRIAIALADTFNAQQKLGIDLNGSAGQNFFSQARPGLISNARNSGNLALTPSFSNTAALTTSDYTLSVRDVSGTLQYTLTRLSDQQPVGNYVGADFPITFDGVSLAMSSGSAQSGDSFLIQPTRSGARDFAVVLTDPAKVAAASPVITGKTAGNQGSGAISAGSVDAGFLALASPLGAAGSVTLTYDGATNQLTGFPAGATVSVTLADGTSDPASPYASGSPVPYAAGARLSFNGITITISGQPANNDTFTVRKNAGGVSDGSNALLLGALQNKKTMDNGSASFMNGYAQLVSSVGNKTRQVQISNIAQASLTTQIRTAQQSVSGVNQDEETANLLMFQQMYQANAKVIQTAATIFDTLLGIR